MAEFLTQAWIDALDEAGRAVAAPGELRLVVQQVVTAVDAGADVAYVVEIRDGGMRVRSGRAHDPDVSFQQDRSTAAAIAQGALSAQVAFMDGRLRLGGDLRSVLDHASDLAVIDDVFAAVRSATTW